MFTIQSR